MIVNKIPGTWHILRGNSTAETNILFLCFYFLVSKAMVDALKSKAKAWEQERNAEFLYDGVSKFLDYDIPYTCEIELQFAFPLDQL